MKIACIGTGFVGVVTSAVFAKLGHKVVGLDIDEQKVKSLSAGEVPFFEPGLKELLQANLKSGQLQFTSDYQTAIQSAEVIFIMVGTPSGIGGQADLKYVETAAKSLAPHLSEGAIVVLKSTVPPGTNPKIEKLIAENTKVKFAVASAPEFLKEGSAVHDTLYPDRILIGTNDAQVAQKLSRLHKPLTSHLIVMKPESAQMAKYASNTYLAMRITFANQIADLCEQNGADIEEVIKGIGADHRIGDHYWYPGLGYGGSCFPKDVKEIAAYAKSVGEKDSIFIAVDQRNSERIPKVLQKFSAKLGGVSGKTIAVLGLSFKPNTDDTREAPANQVVPWLVERGATVRTVDPLIKADYTNPYQAVDGAEVVILLVEWEDYTNLDLAKVAKLMKAPKMLFDTRNQYNPAKVQAAGLTYQGIGR